MNTGGLEVSAETPVCHLRPGKSNWLETGIVERLREELEIPVTHVTVDLDRKSVAAGR